MQNLQDAKALHEVSYTSSIYTVQYRYFTFVYICYIQDFRHFQKGVWQCLSEKFN